MTRPIPTRRRSGFTLLEVLLASAIGVLLLAGLYVAFDLTLSRADAMREEAAHADLTRAVLNRLQLDLASTLGPLPPQSGGKTPAPSESDPAPTVEAAETETTVSEPADDAEATAAGEAPAAGATTTATPIPLGAGVIGTESQLTLFVARVPAALADKEAFALGDSSLAGDARKVTYYVGPDGGLCRQEQPWVTADGVGNSTGADSSTAAADLIAPEVVGASFEYFDGSGWLGTWDGSAMGADGSTILGPPRAVRVALTLAFPEPGGQERRKMIQQVIAVRAAASAAVAGTTTEATDLEGVIP